MILPQSTNKFVVNEQGNTELTLDEAVPYRNYAYEQYIELLRRYPQALNQDQIQALTQDQKRDIELHFCCPISLDLFLDPVITLDGITYERANLEGWLRDGNTTDPNTGNPLSMDQVRPNIMMARLTSEFIQGNQELAERHRGPNRRTMKDVINAYKKRVSSMFLEIGLTAGLPISLASAGSQECMQGNTGKGATLITGGVGLGSCYAANTGLFAKIAGGAAVASVAGASAGAAVETTTVCIQSMK